MLADGIKGVAHIGAIKALEEAKIKFNYIGGTSSGSIVATLYACGFTSNEIFNIFKKYCNKIKYVDFFNILKIILGLIFTGKIIVDGLNSGKQIEKLINKVCEEKGINDISQIKMPIVIPAVDLCNGKVFCFTSKKVRNSFSDDTIFIQKANIGKIVRASCSYPAVFSPCIYEDRLLIDGGIRENVPWKETKLIGADKIINITFENEIDKDCCHNFIDVASRSIELLCRELSIYELEGSDVNIKIKTKKVGLLDIKKINMLYEEGYNQTKEQINKIKEQINK